jgi:hypothetical protein
MTQSRKWENLDEPGRMDVEGVEWWACDPYPTWYRWEDGKLYTNPAQWVPEEPQTEQDPIPYLIEKIEELQKRVRVLEQHRNIAWIS